VSMLHTPHPDLNEEERALLPDAPEQTLRRAVQRGALSLDPVMEQLPPRAAAVVRNMIIGERPPMERGLPTPESEPAGRVEAEELQTLRGQTTYRALSAWPSLQRAVDEGTLTVAEALELARTVDHTLGRYTTGTRYAAP